MIRADDMDGAVQESAGPVDAREVPVELGRRRMVGGMRS